MATEKTGEGLVRREVVGTVKTLFNAEAPDSSRIGAGVKVVGAVGGISGLGVIAGTTAVANSGPVVDLYQIAWGAAEPAMAAGGIALGAALLVTGISRGVEKSYAGNDSTYSAKAAAGVRNNSRAIYRTVGAASLVVGGTLALLGGGMEVAGGGAGMSHLGTVLLDIAEGAAPVAAIGLASGRYWAHRVAVAERTLGE